MMEDLTLEVKTEIQEKQRIIVKHGLVCICDFESLIKKKLLDDGNILKEIEGENLLKAYLKDYIDASNDGKFKDFLMEIEKNKATYGWEFKILIDQKYMTLNFLGAKVGENEVLIGATVNNPFSLYFDEMIKINNNNTSLMRTLMKEISIKEMEVNQDYDERLSEFSTLNNEMASLHRELAKKNNELSRLHEEKDNFIKILAHDLRNPLGTIINFSEYLLEQSMELSNKESSNTDNLENKDEIYKNIGNDLWSDYLGYIKTSGEHMLNLINNLLDIQVMEGGKFKYRFENTEIVRLIKQSILGNQSIAEKKSIKIAFDCELEQLNACIDQTTFQQILSNLLSNAIKFSYPESTVNLRLRKEKESIYIQIQDNGLGMSAENLKKLFTPFSGIGTCGTAGEKSTGLGLFIVKKIINAHGGEILVESTPEVGSTFHIYIPIYKAE